MITTTVEYFDTPFTALEDDYASYGIPVDVRQPTGGGAFSVKAQIDAVGNSTSAVSTFTNNSYSSSVIVDGAGAAISGRVANLIGYWAGGAPGHHGFAYKGKVAYHWRCYIRPAAARKWWDSATTPTWYLAFGGSGYVRIEKVVSGAVSVLYKGDITESHFLENGLRTTDIISNMTAGDYLDIYYVQDEKYDWGGYVFKAVSGTAKTDEAIRNAPVVGCGLFDTGTQPTKKTLKFYSNVEVSRAVNRGAAASFTVGMANMQNFDAIGWEWVKADDADPGNLRMYDASLTSTIDVYRQRLVRIKGGFINTRNVSEIYTMFTGFIDDFGTIQNGYAPVTCVGFDQHILDQHVRNYPDRISYMAYNYKKRKGTAEPVYDVGAYDNWIMEYAIRDLMLRAGIDESVLQQPLKVIKSDNSIDTVTFGSEIYKKVRIRSMAGTHIKLQRPVHYGNVGKAFDKRKPADDEYIYKVDNTKKVWDAVQEFTNKFGYSAWFDEYGHCRVQPLNNPHSVIDLEVISGSTQQTNADAYGATYQQWVGGTPVVTQVVKAARIDLVLPRFVSAGHWNYVVANTGGTVASGTINPALPSGSADEFFYNHRLTNTGANSTIATLYSGDYDDYTVTLTGTGGGTTRRLDAFLLWYADPLTPRYTALFSTDRNAMTVDAQGTVDEMRNYVTVVGRRKAVVTDSEKLDTNPNNPEQEFIVKTAGDPYSVLDPTAKNYVGHTVESLIYDDKITDDDYAEYLATSFIYRYRNPKAKAVIAHTVVPILQLYEPLYGAEQTFETITSQSTLWVQSFTHSFTDRQATTRIETAGYAPLPSFEPREEIDIDGLFGGNPVIDITIDYKSLDNTNKSNVPITAAVLSPDHTDLVSYVKTVTGGSPPYLNMTGNPWPPIPGTVRLYPPASEITAYGELHTTHYTPVGTLSGTGSGFRFPGLVAFNSTVRVPPISGLVSIAAVTLEILLNGNKITSVLSTTPLPNPTVFDPIGQWYYDFDARTNSITLHRLNGPVTTTTTGWGDSTTVQVNNYRFSVKITWYSDHGNVSDIQAIANTPYHHFMDVDYRTATPRVYLPWKHGDYTAGYNRAGTTNYTVTYRKFYPQGYSSDPYSGSCPFYDPYTSELGYLVSTTWDCLVTGLYRISIRSVVDDTVIAWLTEPTADPEEEEAHWSYFTTGANRQVFWDGVDDVGEWNRRQSHLWAIAAQGSFESSEETAVGKGFYVWNQEEDGDGKLGPLAFISDQRDSNTNKPLFGQGTFGAWYVRFEIQADQLGETPRIVDSLSLDPAFNTGTSIAGRVSAVIFTHLPEPTTLEFLEIADFKTGFVFDPDDVSAFDSSTYWQTTPTADAIVSNTKPIRFRYSAKARPGVLWSTNDNWKKASFKLTEVVHAGIHIFDQFVVFDGVNYPGTIVPKRTIVSRRLMNNDHSVAFLGDDYITHDDLKQADGNDGYEFIFIPEDFEVDFGGGSDEAIEFNKYLQLEEVPGWNETRQPTTKRSRLQIAFMNYLFYLSAYAQDRSGRKSWIFNRKFVDRSKIIKNTYADWWNESSPTTPATSTTYRTPWLDDPHYQHRRTVVVRQWQDEGTWRADQRNAFGFAVDSIGDKLLRHKWHDHDPAKTTLNGVAWPTLDRDNYSRWHATDDDAQKIPPQYDTTRQLGTNGTTRLNSWTWETVPSWVPCICRDFHPYHLVPPMVDQPYLFQENIGIINGTWVTGSKEYDDFSYNRYNQYLTADFRDYEDDRDSEEYNKTSDVASSEVWNSYLFDMTETYSTAQSGRVRFWTGRTVDSNLESLKELMAPDGSKTNVLDYMRQDEIMHYEDFRGMFSRGPRPAEPTIKVSPAGPYYVNPYSYIGITIQPNIRMNDGDVVAGSPGFPKVRIAYNANRTGISGWFDMKFRSEYYWESAWLFPTDDKGQERLYAVNHTKTRVIIRPNLRFDSGAWTGWKDDTTTSSIGDSNHVLKFEYRPVVAIAWIRNLLSQLVGDEYLNLDAAGSNVFDTGFMPIAIGPKIIAATGQTITTDMIFSMVLVNERRESSI